MNRLQALAPILLFATGCATLIGEVPTPKSYEKQTQRRAAAAEIEAPRVEARELTPFRLRVWADDEYRTFRGWRTDVETLVGQANAIVEPTFGITFVVVEMAAWNRQAAVGDRDAMLAELARLDLGRGVDRSLGMIRGMAAAEANLQSLAVAQLLGRSLLCRAVNGDNDAKEIEITQRRMKKPEREALVRARIQHRAVVAFLYAWATSLGVPSLLGADNLMSPTYDRSQRTFGEEGKALLEISLRHWRLKSPDDARNRELLAYLEEHPHGAWIERERGHLVAFLKRRPDEASKPELKRGSGPEEISNPELKQPKLPPRLSESEVRSLQQAAQAHSEKRSDEAWRLAAPVAKNNPEHAQTQLFACQLAMVSKAPFEGEKECCERAVALQGASPEAHSALAWVLSKYDAVAATRALDQAIRALGAAPTSPAGAWENLGNLAMNLNAVSMAESIAPKAGEQPMAKLLSWARDTRRRTGLPVVKGPERLEEGQYVQSFYSVLSRFDLDRLEEAERLLQSALARFPDAPGLLALRCGLAGRRGALQEARRLCLRAVEGYAECIQARYFLGLIDIAERDWGSAAARMRTVIELAPELKSAWENLAIALRAAGKAEELKDVDNRYAQRFGEPMRGP